jgi:hypothetical protein
MASSVDAHPSFRSITGEQFALRRDDDCLDRAWTAVLWLLFEKRP